MTKKKKTEINGDMINTGAVEYDKAAFAEFTKKLKYAQFVKAYIKHDGVGSRAMKELKPEWSSASCAAEACKWLKETQVIEMIEEFISNAATAAQVNADWVVKNLLQNHSLAIEGSPIMSNGEQVGVKRDIAASNKALELLGKKEKMFTERVETVHSVDQETIDSLNTKIGDIFDD